MPIRLPRLLALLLLLLPAPLWAQWQVASTPHFRLHADLPTAALQDRARLLEDFHALLVRATGRDLPADAPPLDVFLVRRIADATPWAPLPPDIAGFYRADGGRISAVALAWGDGTPRGLTTQQLLLHEYAHHFLLGASRFPYPAWYVEGFAEYYSTAEFRPDAIEYGHASRPRIAALARLPWIPLDQLLSRRAATPGAADSAIFYAQSWLLTHYLFRAPGMRDRLAAMLKAQGAGMDPVEAFRTHVDPDLKGFQQKLRRYLAARATFSTFTRQQAAPIAVTLQPLPPGASTLLLPLVALEHRAPASRAPQALADIRALAAASPDDPLARRALALAELRAGNGATAATLLDALLADGPRESDLLRWRAEAARLSATAEGRAEARRFLVRAFHAAPNDWRVLHAYARLEAPTAAPSPEALNALLKAHELAPQVSEVVLDTALALARAGRLPEAASVLEPLAASPHGGPASAIARRLLDRARAGDREGLIGEIARIGRTPAAQAR